MVSNGNKVIFQLKINLQLWRGFYYVPGYSFLEYTEKIVK